MWQRSNTHLAEGKTLLRVRISLKNIEEGRQETRGLAQDASGSRNLKKIIKKGGDRKNELSIRQLCSTGGGKGQIRETWKLLLKRVMCSQMYSR